MSDSRDPAIKLFGKTISLPSAGDEGGGDEEKVNSFCFVIYLFGHIAVKNFFF